MAENNTLARPYAQALFELAGAAGSMADWAESLQALAPVAATPEFEAAASNPRMSSAQVLEFIQSLSMQVPGASVFGGGNSEADNFLRLLIENDRLTLLPEIAERFVLLKDAAENTVDVTLTTAADISDGELSSITQALKSRLGREVNVTTTTNKDLIGGAIIRAGDFVIDGSVRSQLDKMTAVLSK
ncbi:MAG: F0F1 ATP synthase subunit delta [Pseudomonadota bacterium]